MPYRERQKRVKETLKEKGLIGAWFFSYENRRYLTGFTGTNGQVFLTQEKLYFLTDGRYKTQAEESVVMDELVVYENFPKAFGEVMQGRKGKVALEGSALTWKEFEEIKKEVSGIDWEDGGAWMRNLRVQKEEEEILLIEKAVEIAESAFLDFQRRIRTGKKEVDLALFLEFALRKKGSGTLPFPIIVASGNRSALPHGVADQRRLKVSDPVIIDFGASYEGYNSDMTFFGTVEKEDPFWKEVVEVLRNAQDKAISAISPGVPCREIDRIAREFLKEAGFGEYFVHSLGHGVGLQIHEPPHLGKNSQDTLLEGMVVTVEPGIYIPGKGGARIEDMVLVEKDGRRKLTKLSKEYQVWGKKKRLPT